VLKLCHVLYFYLSDNLQICVTDVQGGPKTTPHFNIPYQCSCWR